MLSGWLLKVTEHFVAFREIFYELSVGWIVSPAVGRGPPRPLASLL